MIPCHMGYVLRWPVRACHLTIHIYIYICIFVDVLFDFHTFFALYIYMLRYGTYIYICVCVCVSLYTNVHSVGFLGLCRLDGPWQAQAKPLFNPSMADTVQAHRAHLRLRAHKGTYKYPT